MKSITAFGAFGLSLALLASSASGSTGANGVKIGFLIDSNQEQRYDTDRKLFETKSKSDGNELLFASSGGDQQRQIAMAEQLISQGAKVLVVQPVDPKAARELVQLAKRKHIPVVSYDRPIDSPDVNLHVTHDHREVGRLQATNALNAVRGVRDPRVLICAGAENAAVSRSITEGNRQVLEAAGVRRIEVRYHPNWSEDECKATVLRALHGATLDIVLANNTSMISGALHALSKRAGARAIFTAGADGNAEECRLIREGRLSYGVLKPIPPLVDAAYSGAIRLARRLTPEARPNSAGLRTAVIGVQGYTRDDLVTAYSGTGMYPFVKEACGI